MALQQLIDGDRVTGAGVPEQLNRLFRVWPDRHGITQRTGPSRQNSGNALDTGFGSADFGQRILTDRQALAV